MDDQNIIRWIVAKIVAEWKQSKSIDFATALFDGANHKMIDYQPPEPDVGIQCGQYHDFEFTGDAEKAIMDALLNTDLSVFHFVHHEILYHLNEIYENDD